MLYTTIKPFATYFVGTNRAPLMLLMAMLVRQDGRAFV
jgi:hypothetical protein